MTTSTISVTVYTTSDCTRCPQAISRLTKFGLPPQAVNINDSANKPAHRLLVDELNLQQVPLTVITGLFDQPIAFAGYGIDQLLAINHKLRGFEKAALDNVRSQVGLEATGLPTGVTLDQVHWLDASGNLTPHTA